jgi:hypothetical protein
MSSKLTPEEMGRNLEELVQAEELVEEAKRLGTLTKGEVAESIASSGHDQERARAMGRRAAEAFAKAAAEAKDKEAAKVAPDAKLAEKPTSIAPLPPPRPSRWAIPLGIAATFAAVLGLEGQTLVAWFNGVGPTTVGSGKDAGAEHTRALALDDAALEDYRQGHYADCLRKLDEAKALDPETAGIPSVVQLRKDAEAAMVRDGK